MKTITLMHGDAALYAESFKELRTILDVIIDETSSRLGAELESLRANNVALLELRDSMRAELNQISETTAYGPQLLAEREGALAARDQALEENERLREQLESARKSGSDKDRTRRALAAELRRMTAELEAAKDRGDIYEEAVQMQGAMLKKRPAVKGRAKKTGRKK